MGHPILTCHPPVPSSVCFSSQRPLPPTRAVQRLETSRPFAQVPYPPVVSCGPGPAVPLAVAGEGATPRVVASGVQVRASLGEGRLHHAGSHRWVQLQQRAVQSVYRSWNCGRVVMSRGEAMAGQHHGQGHHHPHTPHHGPHGSTKHCLQ